MSTTTQERTSEVSITVLEAKLKEIVNQVKSNNIDRINKVCLRYKGTEPIVTIHSGYKFLGTHQVCAWKNKPYSQKADMILATFKLKFEGTPLTQFNVTTGMILPEYHGEQHLTKMINNVVQIVGSKLFSKR